MGAQGEVSDFTQFGLQAATVVPVFPPDLSIQTPDINVSYTLLSQQGTPTTTVTLACSTLVVANQGADATPSVVVAFTIPDTISGNAPISGLTWLGLGMKVAGSNPGDGAAAPVAQLQTVTISPVVLDSRTFTLKYTFGGDELASGSFRLSFEISFKLS